MSDAAPPPGRVRFYAAVSLDGYLADTDGSVEWLYAFSEPDEGDYGYAAFYASIGALVMGHATYRQVRTFGDWPYPGKPCVVFAHAPDADTEHPQEVTFTTGPIASVVEELRPAGDIWLVGGAELLASFRRGEFVDEYLLTVMPVLLGDGVPLFRGGLPRQTLQLKASLGYGSGVVQLSYAVEASGPSLPPSTGSPPGGSARASSV